MQNFVEAARAGRPDMVRAPVEQAAHIAKLSHMANIAFRVGHKLHWDNKEQVFAEKEANRYLAAAYHNGYKIPTV